MEHVGARPGLGSAGNEGPKRLARCELALLDGGEAGGTQCLAKLGDGRQRIVAHGGPEHEIEVGGKGVSRAGDGRSHHHPPARGQASQPTKDARSLHNREVVDVLEQQHQVPGSGELAREATDIGLLAVGEPPFGQVAARQRHDFGLGIDAGTGCRRGDFADRRR